MGWAIAIVVIIAVAGVIAASYYEARQWQRFSEEHHCKVVGQESGSYGVGVGSDGKVTTIFTAGKTGYLCDDGVTYWR